MFRKILLIRDEEASGTTVHCTVVIYGLLPLGFRIKLQKMKLLKTVAQVLTIFLT